MTRKKKVVFIMGMGHSGSTLLELILSSHADVFGLGELYSLREKVDKADTDRTGLCSICEGPCEYWNCKASRSDLRRYFSYKRPYSFITRQIARYHKSIYHYLFDWFDYDILVDSSKRVSWIKRQLRPSYHWRHMEPVLLYITRDGRAVVNSYLRKYPHEGIDSTARNWKNNVVQMNRFYERFAYDKQIVAYERLATEPAKTAETLCNFLDIPYDPQVLHYWEHDHHLCDGNLGTRSLIYRYRARFGQNGRDWSGNMAELKANHGNYYEQVGLAIKLDLRWVNELTPEQLAVFHKIAGKDNEPFAYQP